MSVGDSHVATQSLAWLLAKQAGRGWWTVVDQHALVIHEQIGGATTKLFFVCIYYSTFAPRTRLFIKSSYLFCDKGCDCTALQMQ